MYILARLNTNGQAISVANAYKDAKIQLKGAGFKEALAKAKTGGKTRSQNCGHISWWYSRFMDALLASQLMVSIRTRMFLIVPVPPPQMVSNMKTVQYGSLLCGRTLECQVSQSKARLYSIGNWRTVEEIILKKLSAMRADWVDKNPNAAKAIIDGK